MVSKLKNKKKIINFLINLKILAIIIKNKIRVNKDRFKNQDYLTK